LLSPVGIAQIPNTYYTTATGTGYTFKHNYTTLSKATLITDMAGLTLYQTSDSDYYFENDATILDMY
jgi:hypothetical protein